MIKPLPKVAVTLPIPEPGVSILSAAANVVVRPDVSPLDEGSLIEFIGDSEGLVAMLTDTVTDRVLSSCSRLRVVGNFAVGTNNVDLYSASRNGIWVTNTPGVLTDDTADLTIALILAVMRRVVEGDKLLRTEGFGGWMPEFFLGTSLSAKQLGIIGLGRIGLAVAARAAAFGMRVSYASRSESSEGELLGFERRNLQDLLASCDVVSIHTPLTDRTRHMIDADALALMKQDSILINTSRGPVVDENALVAALSEGRIRGAGLDVFEHEPAVHPDLIGLDNVVLVPHIGSATRETRARMSEIVTTDVARILTGLSPIHPVVKPDRPR